MKLIYKNKLIDIVNSCRITKIFIKKSKKIKILPKFIINNKWKMHLKDLNK